MLNLKLDMSQLKVKSNIFGGIVIIATFIFTFSANGELLEVTGGRLHFSGLQLVFERQEEDFHGSH